MLPILLLILKIIGIAVLALLGLAVVILLLVLVVPVRYALAGSFDGNVRLQARITWLLTSSLAYLAFKTVLGLDNTTTDL